MTCCPNHWPFNCSGVQPTWDIVGAHVGDNLLAFGLLPPALFGVPGEILRERTFDEKPKVMPTDTRGSFMVQGLSKMRHQLLSRLPGHQRAINKK